MEVRNNTPCGNWALVCVAGCNDDGLVYAAAIDPVTFDMNLWVHSGVQEKWHMLATLKLTSSLKLVHGNRLMSAALTHGKNCVDVFVEAEQSTAYLFRFFISNPKGNCIYKCIDAEKIQFYDFTGPDLHWLGYDCLLVAGIPRHDTSNKTHYHVWRIDLNKESMVFTLTDVLVYDLSDVDESAAVSVCTDEEFLYVFGVPPDQIKLYTKSPDGTIQLCKEVMFPNYAIMYDDGHIVAYPVTGGQRLWLTDGEDGYMFDCQLQSLQQMFKIDDDDFDEYEFDGISENQCTVSSAQFFYLKKNGIVGQICIGMPSLQYLCLQELCETWPALEMCTDEKEATNLGIPRTIWNRFFKPWVKVEES